MGIALSGELLCPRSCPLSGAAPAHDYSLQRYKDPLALTWDDFEGPFQLQSSGGTRGAAFSVADRSVSPSNHKSMPEGTSARKRLLEAACEGIRPGNPAPALPTPTGDAREREGNWQGAASAAFCAPGLRAEGYLHLAHSAGRGLKMCLGNRKWWSVLEQRCPVNREDVC